jgi:hypothetical protein
MVSGWWLLAVFWIGGCLGILIAVLLHMRATVTIGRDSFCQEDGSSP